MVQEEAEGRLLAACIVDEEAWVLAVEAGLTEGTLRGNDHRRVYVELATWYSQHAEAPGTDAMELRVGAVVRNLAGGLLPTFLASIPGVVAELVRARHAESAALLRNRAKLALARNEHADAERLLADAKQVDPETAANASAGRYANAFHWLDVDNIFAPLRPAKWNVAGLQIGPGRAAIIGGYGASGKTLAAQQLGLAVATGGLVWGHFVATRGKVRHLDYEQGENSTRKRYQRLALGHGIDTGDLGDRLQLSVMPRVFLDDVDAFDGFSRACDGADLVIIDSLKAASPATDENSSEARSCVDLLTRVSERTGAAIIAIHHAGKPKDGHSDRRTVLRGSSAIYDAGGSVLLINAGKSRTDPRRIERRIEHIKPSAASEGGFIDDFMLEVDDVELAGNPTAGVRVMHRPIESAPDEAEQASGRYYADSAKLLDVIRNAPGASQNVILQTCGMQRTRAAGVLKALEDQGRICSVKGERGAKSYRLKP